MVRHDPVWSDEPRWDPFTYEPKERVVFGQETQQEDYGMGNERLNDRLVFQDPGMHPGQHAVPLPNYQRYRAEKEQAR